ncbi:MAG: ribosome-binding factor A [Elusimicrobia bacterium]|nr:ribosome-binding factor A [Elusimicrobiota bacterium]
MRNEISRILEDHREKIFETAGSILLTITRVEVARNLEKAIVRYSWTAVSSDPQNADLAQQALEDLEPEITRELKKRLTIKRLPRLSFIYDNSMESADRVLQILNSLHANEGSAVVKSSKGKRHKK